MTGRLHDMLDELAAGATTAPDPDQVIARDRRRRRRIAAALPALVVAAAVGAGVAVAAWQPEKPQPPAVRQAPAKVPVTDATGPVGTGRLPWLPSVVESPDTATPLPVDRAVGKGSLIYVGCPGGCAAYLVTEDGAQYQLSAVGSPYDGAALSPDGRWLGLRGEDGYVLRDLAGTTRREFPAPRPGKPVGWSADGRWLVVPTSADEHLLIDATTGESWPFQFTSPIAVLSSGTVIGAPEGRYRLPLLDPRTGEESQLRVDLRQALHRDETLGLRVGWAARPDGELAAFTVRKPVESPAGATIGEDVVLVDMSTGQVVRRFDLPTSRLGPQPEDPNDTPVSMDARRVVAYLTQGVLLAHTRIDGDDTEFELLDPKTGKRKLVTVLRGSMRHLVRGGVPTS